MINIIASNLPLANCWAKEHNIGQFIYVTDEAQIRREYETVIIGKTFSKEKLRLIKEVEMKHTRVKRLDG